MRWYVMLDAKNVPIAVFDSPTAAMQAAGRRALESALEPTSVHEKFVALVVVDNESEREAFRMASAVTIDESKP